MFFLPFLILKNGPQWKHPGFNVFLLLGRETLKWDLHFEFVFERGSFNNQIGQSGIFQDLTRVPLVQGEGIKHHKTCGLVSKRYGRACKASWEMSCIQRVSSTCGLVSWGWINTSILHYDLGSWNADDLEIGIKKQGSYPKMKWSPWTFTKSESNCWGHWAMDLGLDLGWPVSLLLKSLINSMSQLERGT